MNGTLFRERILGFWSSHPVCLPRKTRLFTLLAFVPFVLLILLCWLLARYQKPESLETAKGWALALGALLFFAMGFAFSVSLCSKLAIVRARIRREGFRSLLALLFVCGMVMALVLPWLLSTRAEDAARATVELLTLTPYLVLLGLLWLMRDGKKEEPPAPAAEAESVADPDWLPALLAQLPKEWKCVRDDDCFRALATARPSPKDDYDFLFGVRPTEDQVRLVERFVDSYGEALSGFRGEGPEVEPSADLLVDGDPGSGRSTALLACAAHAAFVRGQRVLYLVPGAMHRDLAERRFARFLSAAFLQWYVKAEALGEERLVSWLRRPETAPQIVIATPESAEAVLYGSLHSGDAERLRRLILSFAVVLVDDLTEFGEEARAHVPFLLDKQRLLLAAENLPLQTVVVFPGLTDTARAVAGIRLFTEKRFKRATNAVSLRPRPAGPVRKVNVTVPDARKAVDELVVRCLNAQKGQLDVVLYRPGIDEHERQRQAAKFERQAGGRKPEILGHYDQALEMPAKDVDAIVYPLAVHGDACLALRMKMGGKQTVIFSIREMGEPARDLGGVIPVLADRGAAPLAAAHLQSAARFLPPGVPVPADAWHQLGVNLEQLPRGWPDRAQAPDAQFDLDPWADSEQQAWPYVVLRQGSARGEPVRLFDLPDESRGLYVYPSGQGFFLGRTAESLARARSDTGKRRLTWWSGAGKLRESDLAHLRELRLQYGSDAFVVDGLRESDDGFAATTQPWQGTGEDAYLPVYDIAWELGGELAVDSSGGGRDYGVAWLRIGLPDPGYAMAQVALRGLLTDYGFKSPVQTARIAYRARFNALILRPGDLDPDRLTEGVGSALAGSWDSASGERFRPALSAAVNFAFDARMPGLGHYARAVVFGLEKEKDLGEAVVWLVEPWSSGGTVMPVLGQVLRQREERARLWAAAASVLAEARKDPARATATLRRFSRAGYERECDPAQIEADAQLVAKLLNG